MLCAAGRPLGLPTWLAVPYLFATAVIGLTGLASLLLGSFDWSIGLSAPVFGAATAVAIATGSAVRWRSTWQRRWLRWTYPWSVLVLGVATDGLRLPVLVMTGLGIPVVALLIRWYVVERRRTTALAASGRYTSAGC
ncbi:hypothetical protein [Umezawaea tangerina]|uniref:Uncharacterized protein n=1 Tax=Umezawaea tangerina TaxID=84725 RepID=A0A2T0SLL3_9PSEU|nr:hypothetical protein [Umezawaea tangerina]PRY34295.1 hypothetical protein CLV43_11769 [Umezawaea tangerina]